jgi:hypothetical protein
MQGAQNRHTFLFKFKFFFTEKRKWLLGVIYVCVIYIFKLLRVDSKEIDFASLLCSLAGR